MSLEQKINYQLDKFPFVKKAVKRVYQRAMMALSPKFVSEGPIFRLSPDEPSREYFCGYYDKSPWAASERFVLCLRAKATCFDVSSKEKNDILLIDTALSGSNPTRVHTIAKPLPGMTNRAACFNGWFSPASLTTISTIGDSSYYL